MSYEIYKAPTEVFGHLELKPSNYMTENFADEFKIYRLLAQEEIDDIPDGKIVVSGNGDFMIYVGTAKSKEEAQAVIHSYWDAIRQLNAI